MAFLTNSLFAADDEDWEYEVPRNGMGNANAVAAPSVSQWHTMGLPLLTKPILWEMNTDHQPPSLQSPQLLPGSEVFFQPLSIDDYQLVPFQHQTLPLRQAQPRNAALTSKRRYATKEDWETHRVEITCLYSDKNCSLKEVMKEMEVKHGFFATPKMFKDRLRSWKLSKHLSDQDARDILTEKTRRDAMGKKSDFYMGNRKIDHKRALQHLERKKPWTIVGNHNTQRNLSNRPLETRRIRVATPPATPPPPPLRAPDDIGRPEEIIWLLRNYVNGNFDKGTWIVDEDGELINPTWLGETPSIREFQVLYYSGCEMLGENVESAKRLLNMACEMVKSILAYQHISLIRELLYTVVGSISTQSQVERDLGKLFWEDLVSISATTLGENHPLPQLWRALGHAIVFSEQLDSEQLELMEMFIAVMTERIENRFGRVEEVIALLHGQSNLVRVLASGEASLLHAERTLGTIQNKILLYLNDGTSTEHDVQVMQSNQAKFLRHTNRPAEALEKLEQILSIKSNDVVFRFDCLQLKGCIEFDLERLTEAEASFVDALKIGEEENWEETDPDLLDVIGDLLDVLQKRGLWDQHARLYDDYRDRISALEREREITWEENTRFVAEA